MQESLIVKIKIAIEKGGLKVKNFGKILALILVLCLVALTGCGSDGGATSTDATDGTEAASVPYPDAGDTVSEVINIAALNGPTGMGMVKLMDQTDKYAVTTYQAPTDITGKLISGEVDIAALPSNMAAVLYNKTEGQVVAVSPIALGVLYILGNDVEISDVKDLAGKTIYSSGQGGTPEYVLQKVLESAGLTIYEDVQVEWLASHADVNQKLLSEDGAIAMVPEPFVSTALASSETVSQLFDLNELWKAATGQELPMGVLVATKSFVDEHEADLEVLLNDYQASVDYVNGDESAASLIVEKGFLAKEEIAKTAIPRCNIVLYAGENAGAGTEILKTFNETLFEMNPQAVGGKLPGDELYFGAAE